MIRATFIALFLLVLPAQAEEVVAGLSQNRVAITANFDGSEILIFGAVKRDTPPPETGPLQVIVTVAGPSEPVTVRRKARRYGIWVNVDTVEIDAAPSFYSIATTAPFSDVISDEEDLLHHVSIPNAIRSAGANATVDDTENFSGALIRIRENAEAYQISEGAVSLADETLFETRIALPANLTEGDYQTRIFLTRDGKVIDLFQTEIDVRKVGLERFLFNLAQERALIYGILSLVIAIFAGWGASAVFTYIRS